MPSANAAATARIGYSSIMVGARSAGTSTPFSAPALHPQIGDVLAALVALLEHLDRRAHLPQRRQQAGAQRIDHHAFEDRPRSPARSAPPPAGTRPTTDRPAPRPARPRARAGPRSVMRRPCSPIGDRRGCCAPKCLSIFSVWSRVASFSITVVAPGAASPASSTADLSCADGTGASYSIGIGSRAPCTHRRQPAALADLQRCARPSSPADRGCAASAACAGWRRRRRWP